MPEIQSIKNPLLERDIFIARIVIAFVVALIICAVLGWRMTQLQVTQHEYYSTRSDDNRMQPRVIPPPRGLIYDRNGNVLAENLPAYQLVVIPERIADMDATLSGLAEFVSLRPSDLERFKKRLRSERSFREIPLKFQMSDAEVARFEVNRQSFPGTFIRAALTRHYPAAEITAHVLGYVGGINDLERNRVDERRYRGSSHIGKTGIELSYEDELIGYPGSKLVETNASGRTLRQLEHESAKAGNDVFLTLDVALQTVAVKAMADRRGAAVAMDPNNGDVLAIVSQPGFDPHLFVNGIGHKDYAELREDPGRPLFNRAVQGQYPPGSTIKPIMALAGLEHKVFSPQRRVKCEGHYSLPNHSRKYRDWKRSGHGNVNLKHAIAQSCDVYFYLLAHELKVDRIYSFASLFGLGAITGIDLPGEKSGILPSRAWKRRIYQESWYPGETLNIGIGQGFMTATPLQLAYLTSRIATRGRGATPHLMLAISEGPESRPRQWQSPALSQIELNRESDWNAVIGGMKAVTHGVTGTARRIGENSPFLLAGKTGTAQVKGLSQEDDEAPQLEDVPYPHRDHAWFIAYAPIENPSIAVAVLAEHSGSGGAVAAPIAKKIIDKWLQLHPPELLSESAAPAGQIHMAAAN